MNFGDPVVTSFLKRWPTLQDVQRSKPDTLRKFYHANKVRHQDTIEKRIERLMNAQPLTEDPIALEAAYLQIQMLAKEIELATKTVAEYDRRLVEAFNEHPDKDIYQSLPYAGPALAPRLLAAMGDQRDRLEDANQLQCLSGIAPRRQKSGDTINRIKHRFTCSKFVRQTFMEWAGLTIRAGGWAQAYYEQQREHGSKHHKAVRALAYKWQRILFRCWKDRVPYDEKTHQASLAKHGSPLVKRIEALAAH